MSRYSEDDCIEALKKAKKELGKSPTMRDYNQLDILPCADTIIQRFGSWNKAKEKANLETYKLNNKLEPKPSNIEIPEDKKWENLTPYQRYYYKNREKEKERTKKRSKKIKTWFKKFKSQFKCEECGEDHPACLDFHHVKDKEAGVTELAIRQKVSKERIKEEVKKCKVLCSNCHRKVHSNIEQ